MDNQKNNMTEEDKGLNAEKRKDSASMSGQAGNGQAGSSGSSAGGQQNSKAADSSSDAAGESGNLVELAKSTAGDAYDAVSEKASSVISERKSDFTYGLVGVAETVRRVGSAITEGESKNGVTEFAATYTDTAAEKLESVAMYFEETDLRGLARDVESYARQNPAVFLGAAFALGVLAARFIKSEPPTSSSSIGAIAKRKGSQRSSDASVGVGA